MTVKDLKEALNDYDDNRRVFVSLPNAQEAPATFVGLMDTHDSNLNRALFIFWKNQYVNRRD